MFCDRADAGRRLSRHLMPWREAKPIVIALSDGGVPVAVEVAEALGASFDVLFVRSSDHPQHPQMEIGALCRGTHGDPRG